MPYTYQSNEVKTVDAVHVTTNLPYDVAEPADVRVVVAARGEGPTAPPPAEAAGRGEDPPPTRRRG